MVPSHDDDQVFPFVVGCSRSGTTLLRAMLDSHPELAIPGESHFIPELWGSFGRKRWSRRRARELHDTLRGHPRFEKWQLADDDVVAALEGARGFPDAIRGLYRGCARARGKPRYGDKTPDYVDHISLLAEFFSEARFVHLIRDGRHVALSLVDVPFGPDTLPSAATYWADKVRAGRRAGGAAGTRRYLEVRYEELVRDPGSSLKEVSAFIDLPFDPAMLRYTERSDEVVAAALRPDVHSRVAEPPTEGVRDWRRDLSPDDAAHLTALIGDLLEELGYEGPVTPA
jgi:hypothetical protein